jgi:hypothetical protein
MKINVDIDCTPEEARSFLGLPDLSPIHELFVEQMKRTISQGVTPDMVEAMFRNWSPIGDAGMAVWKQMIDRMAGGTGKS